MAINEGVCDSTSSCPLPVCCSARHCHSLRPGRRGGGKAEARPELIIQDGHSESVASVSFSPDGRIIASGGYGLDRTVKLWDVAGGGLLRSFETYRKEGK